MRVKGVPYVQGRNSYGPADLCAVAIHCTDNTAPAENEAAYATRRTDGVGSHFYVDRDSIVQSIDTAHRTGHAGSRHGNHNAVAVEITGRSTASRQWWLDNVAWGELASALAEVCDRHDITPRRASVTQMKGNPRVRAFYGHDDMRRAWGGTTHTDPGPHFPWDHLIKTVTAAMRGEQEESVTPTEFLAILRDPDVRGELRVIGALGTHAALHVANTQEDFAGLTYEGPGSVGKSIRQNLAGLVAIGAGDVDESAIVGGILAGLSAEQIAGLIVNALPENLAEETATAILRKAGRAAELPDA